MRLPLTVSTQCQLLSTCVNSVKVGCLCHVTKVCCQVTLQEKWLLLEIFAVCGAGLGSELTTYSLRKKNSWICLSISFSIPCINLHCDSSSPYLHCKLKLMKILLDLNLDEPHFLVIAYMKQQKICSLCLWNRKGRPKAEASP